MTRDVRWRPEGFRARIKEGARDEIAREQLEGLDNRGSVTLH